MPVTIQPKIIGKNLQTNTDIIAKEYIFPKRIYKTYIDSTGTTCSIQLRGTHDKGRMYKNRGTLLIFDLAKSKPLWAKPLNYRGTSLMQTEGILMHCFPDRTTRLNLENGNNIWDLKTNIYYAKANHNIAIGYPFGAGISSNFKLQGLDLQTGKTVWLRTLSRENGWKQIYALTDSTLLIVASGLHSVNLKNGTGWSYVFKTEQIDYTPLIAANMIGITAGALTGMYILTAGSDVNYNLVSNLLVDSASVYIASNTVLTCLSHQGQVKWTYKLPDDFGSSSSLFFEENTICLVNHGFADHNKQKVFAGKPFFATFDKATGQKQHLTIISNKKLALHEFTVHNRNLYFLIGNSIKVYSLETGALVKERAFSVKDQNELLAFARDNVFIRSKHGITRLADSDTTLQHVFCKSEKVIALNADLEIVKQYSKNDLYFYGLKTNDHKFFINGIQTVVTNNYYQPVASLALTKNAKLVGSKLYDTKGNSLLEIDLANISKN